MRIGIVGGGIAGLVAGYRLSQAGHRVSVFEQRPRVGGQVATFELAGVPPAEWPNVEVFYHHMFHSDHELQALLRELGLEERLQWIESRMGFFHGGRIYDFGTPVATLKFTPLGLIDRIRLGLMVLFLIKYGNWRKLESVTARDWVIKWGGRRVWDVVIGPLMQGKFGDRANSVSMTWLWGKFHLRGSSRSQSMQKETLGYLAGSFQVLLDELVRQIQAAGGEVLTGLHVEKVVTQEGRVVGITAHASGTPVADVAMRKFDRVVVTTPSPRFLGMCPDLPADYAALVRSVDYQAALCLVLTCDRSLSPIYWMNISDPKIPFVGVIEHTNYIPRERYGGRRIIYVTNYLEQGDPLLSLDKEALLEAYLPHLRKINSQFGPEWVKELCLFGDAYGQPVMMTEYSARMPSHRTPVSGLYLANTTQIYPEDRGMNYSVRLGESVSRLMLEDARGF